MNKFIIKLENKYITSFKELGENIYLHEDAAEKLLTSNKFLSFLRENDKGKYDQLIKINHKARDFEEFIFLSQYIFSPFMNIRHHTYAFNTLEELGEQIISFGPEVDIYLKDFLKYHLLSQYMVMVGWDKQKPHIYKKVLELEELYLKNENKAYFLLGFVLSGRKNLVYYNETYDEPQELFKALTHEFNVISYSHSLEKSQYIIAWLTHIGYEDAVREYEAINKLLLDMEQKYDN